MPGAPLSGAPPRYSESHQPAEYLFGSAATAGGPLGPTPLCRRTETGRLQRDGNKRVPRLTVLDGLASGLGGFECIFWCFPLRVLF